MINNIRDFIDEKGLARFAIPLIIVVLIVIGLILNFKADSKSNASNSTSTNEPVASATTVPDDYDSTSDPNAEAISNDNIPATPNSTESVVVENDEAEQPSTAQTISDYLINTGDYNNFPSSEDSWRIEDLSSYADQDESFGNLFIYKGYGHYAHDLDGHSNGGEVMFTCYVTKLTDGNTVIHYIARDGEVIVNDGFVTDNMMRIMNGDLEG